MNRILHSPPPCGPAAVLLPLLCGAVLLSASAADWPGWRGPQRNDHSPDTGLLKKWPEGGPKRVWLNNNVGLGYAGFSIVEGKLHTMGLRDGQEFLLTLDAGTGKELRAVPIGGGYDKQPSWGNGPRGTPTADGDHLFALGGQGNLLCVSRNEGESTVVWKKSLTADLGGKLPTWGYAESPLIVGDLVICTPGGDQGTLAALRKSTGEVAWRTTSLSDGAHYASPILAVHAGKPQIIQLVEKKVFGVDPANGNVLWQQDWPGQTAVIPTPIYHDHHVYISSGYGVGCRLIRLAPDNTPTTVYNNKVMKNHHGGVILVGDHLYGYSDGPGWVCQDFRTGEEVWANKSLPKGALHYADGMLYCLAETTGDVALIEASPKGWTEHGRFTLDPQTRQRAPRGQIWTHPVVLNGRLYLRDQEFLSCYDVKG